MSSSGFYKVEDRPRELSRSDSGPPKSGKDVNNNSAASGPRSSVGAFSTKEMDEPIMNSTLQTDLTRHVGVEAARSPGVVSTKASTVFEDALEVQNRPFSAVSSADSGGAGRGGVIATSALERTTTMLGIIGVVATAMSVLSVVLIIRFDFKQGDSTGQVDGTTGWGGLVWYESLLDIGTVLASFCLMLNLHCVVVCVSQCYFASKMIKLPHGVERSLKYLRNTSCLRYFAVSSFAVGVPIFILALCTYLLLEFRLVAASVSSGLLVLGILMIICSFTHSMMLWHWEKHKVASSVKPKCSIYNIDGRFAFTNHIDLLNFTDSNLSTMV